MTQAVDNESTKQAASKIINGAESLERYAVILEAFKKMQSKDERKAIKGMLAVLRGLKK
jgi:hypothetical protein